MNHQKSWSRRKRISCAVFAVAALATSAWAAITHTESFALTPAASKLDAPIPQPQDVLIQQRDNSDGVGNTFVFVQLTPEQVRAKKEEGTADFLTLGTEDSTVMFRDDGAGGDLKAGDGLYTGIAEVDREELQARAALDEEVLAGNPDGQIPLFEGRSATGVVRPAAFDFNGFAKNELVQMVPRAFFLQQEGVAPPPITFTDPVVPGTNSFQEHVLMLTNTDVVTDPARVWNPCTNIGNANGVWTFNHLMTGIANPASTNFDPSDFVKRWLKKWTSLQDVNDDAVPARSAMQDIIDQWPKLANGELDLTKSPLRLLAIVPRVDLRNGTGGGYSGGGGFKNGGELRFVFGFVAKETTTFDPAQAFIGAEPINGTSCYALPFTVIFEYRVPRKTCEDVRSWAQQWVSLKDLDAGTTPTYNSKLELLTEEIVAAGADSDRVNGSALRQLRTNEVALGAPWELREFQLTGSLGAFSYLEETPVLDTIRNDLNNSSTNSLLLDWIRLKAKTAITTANNNEAEIPLVTPTFQGQPFLAGASHIIEPNPNLITFHRTAPGQDVIFDMKENWARHRVSRAGCDGCHSRDTFTQFTHINSAKTMTIIPSDPALPAELSVFLTGINQLGDPAYAAASSATVSNPGSGLPKRNFDDLARRELDINNVAHMSCSGMMHVNRSEVLRSLEMTGKLPDDLFKGVSPDERLSVAIDDMKRNVINEVH